MDLDISESGLDEFEKKRIERLGIIAQDFSMMIESANAGLIKDSESEEERRYREAHAIHMFDNLTKLYCTEKIVDAIKDLTIAIQEKE